ncbi:hypothetical protein, partial [Desulfocicer niacini]
MITNAYIEFETDETDSRLTSLSITAQDSDDASAFSSSSFDVSNRQTVNASVIWNDVTPWDVVDQKHQSSDLSSVVQSVVDRSGWSEGNAIAFVITGTGLRIAEAYEGEPGAAPILHV